MASKIEVELEAEEAETSEARPSPDEEPAKEATQGGSATKGKRLPGIKDQVLSERGSHPP